jgi:hypothetical protein
VGESDRSSWFGRSGGVAERRSLRRGDVDAALAQSVALAFERDHGGVVDEPLDQGGGSMRDTLAKLANRPERPS